MSTPNPGDVLLLWNPDIPGEEVQTGRLGLRVRPGRPAAAKVAALEAAGGAELLRQVLEEQRTIDGIYTIIKPEKPLEFVGQVRQSLLTGRLGRTPMGLALEITDWQDLDGEFEMEKNRLRLGFQELQLVKEGDGDLEGFTARGLAFSRRTIAVNPPRSPSHSLTSCSFWKPSRRRVLSLSYSPSRARQSGSPRARALG